MARVSGRLAQKSGLSLERIAHTLEIPHQPASLLEWDMSHLTPRGSFLGGDHGLTSSSSSPAKPNIPISSIAHQSAKGKLIEVRVCAWEE